MSTREDIVAAATRIYADEGPNGFSMRRIARDVGLSATALYRHFENKEELTIAVGLGASRVFESYLLRSLKASTPAERMDAMGNAYRAFALEQPAYYRVLFMSPHPEFENLRDETVAEFNATFRLLVDRVRENQDAGHFNDGPSEVLAVTIWAQVHGLVSLYLDGHLGEDEEQFTQLFDQSIGAVLRGLHP